MTEATQDIKNDSQAKEAMKIQFLRELNDYHIGKVDLSTISKPQAWALQGDGLYLFHKNRIGVFVNRVMDMKIPGLEIQFERKNTYMLFIPKINKSFYDQIVNFFKDVNEKFNVSEAFVQLYYDLKEGKYVANVPTQKVGASRVKYDASQNLNNLDPKRYIFVFEVHSHGNMGAFFSSVDNADEKDTRFYGVIGDFNKPQLSEKYRYMIGKEEALLPREAIFDFTKPTHIAPTEIKKLLKGGTQLTIEELQSFIELKKNTGYPKEWMEKIKKDSHEDAPVSCHERRIIDKTSLGKNTQESEFELNDYDFGRDPRKKYIGSIPVQLYAESMEVIYDMTEFEPEEVEHIFDLMINSLGQDEVDLLCEKLMENNMLPSPYLEERYSRA